MNVAGEPIRLRDHEPSARAAALIDGSCHGRAGIVLAALVLLELTDELPIAAVEEPGHGLALRLDPERLLGGRGPVVGHEEPGRHGARPAVAPVLVLITISNDRWDL